MNKEAIIIKKWMSALRSGNYKKCDGIMHLGDMFCAYGVLCDLHATEFGKEWHKPDMTDVNYYHGASYIPPQQVRHWLGDELWKILQGYAPTVDLISDKSMTLSEAADEIEKKIKIHCPNFFEEE